MQKTFARHVPRLVGAVLACAASFAAMTGCSTAPTDTSSLLTPAERIQRDQVIGMELARQFESRLKLRQDADVQVYLRNLAGALGDATPELRSANVGVLVIDDKAKSAPWRDYGFPGNRIYLSRGLLRGVEYENELAAAIAVELGHILKRHALGRIQEADVRRRGEPSGSRGGMPGLREIDYPALEGLLRPASGEAPEIDYLGPAGVFAFPDEFHLAAFEQAVGILYRAGFDSRGLISLLDRYAAHPERSPYDPALLQKLTEKTRRAIALLTPLRNPIVRSQAFLLIHKRIRKL